METFLIRALQLIMSLSAEKVWQIYYGRYAYSILQQGL